MEYLNLSLNELKEISYSQLFLRFEANAIPKAAKNILATRLIIKHINGHFICKLTTQIQQPWLDGEKFLNFLFPSNVTEFLKFHFKF